MGYLKIPNLYKSQEILLFKECFALQKIHGTSCHLSFKDGQLKFFSGGVNHEDFVKLFDQDFILKVMPEYGNITVYGEGYGGKCQKMSDTYGKNLKFVAFDVKINDSWLNVPAAESVVKSLGLEFVYYERIPTTMEEIDRMRDMYSVQGVRNGIPKMPEEGVVLRPLVEMTLNNGSRVICKHKKDSFRETKKVRQVTDPTKLEKLVKAQEIADEWVTPMRLNHVVDKIELNIDICNISSIIPVMIEDIKIESEGEVEWSKECEKAIGNTTAKLVKTMCKENIK